jgi:hypothetical protein
MYRVFFQNAIANDSGTTATLSVGTTASGTDIINATSMKAAANTNVTTTPDWRYITADQPLYLTPTYSGTASTVGMSLVCVQVVEVNLKEATAQGD